MVCSEVFKAHSPKGEGAGSQRWLSIFGASVLPRGLVQAPPVTSLDRAGKRLPCPGGELVPAVPAQP